MRCHEADEPVDTVFIGGGTPSLLAAEQFSDLVRGIRNVFSFRDPVEFSVEANPGTVSEKFLRAAVSAGVNRMSLGMQAYQTPILQFLGRIHTFEDVKRSVGLIRSSGIRNINLSYVLAVLECHAVNLCNTLGDRENTFTDRQNLNEPLKIYAIKRILDKYIIVMYVQRVWNSMKYRISPEKVLNAGII